MGTFYIKTEIGTVICIIRDRWSENIELINTWRNRIVANANS